MVALFKIAGESGLEENRVNPELGVQQWHVAVDLCELVYAEVTFRKVFVISRQIVWAAGAPECPPGGDLPGRREREYQYIGTDKLVFTMLFTLHIANWDEPKRAPH